MAAVVLLLAILGQVNGKGFLSPKAIDPSYIDSLVQQALVDVLGTGHNINHDRWTKINATLAPLFHSLPKNGLGHVKSPTMQYAVQRYFSQRHGWVVKGFEPNSLNMSQSEDQDPRAAHIVQAKIPGYVEAVLEKSFYRQQGGFALLDIAVVVASIERLVFDENLKALNAAYELNSMPTSGALGTPELMTVLTSYFIIEHLNGDSDDTQQHLFDSQNIGRYYPHWEDTLNFMTDIVGEDAFVRKHIANPFSSFESYAFSDVARITRIISESFGPFSNHECHDMKMSIAELDVHGTGRVKLSDFYATGQYLESAEYLDSLGALDTSSEFLGAQVIIPNYLLGINNCISTSSYYDICCLNECDGIFQHLEAHIAGPAASAAEITRLIEGGIASSALLSSSAPTEPRNLSLALHERLTQIAAHHDGQIPLHGRLFAQWLHYAFPRECPFPHMSGTVVRHYSPNPGEGEMQQHATEEQMKQHILSDVGRREASPLAGQGMWSEQEELLAPTHFPSGRSLARTVVYVVMLASFSVVAAKELFRLGHLRMNKNEAFAEASHHI